jgi:hypothetical protein
VKSYGALRRELVLITLRQKFRRLCDVVHLGPSTGERLCFALMVGVIPFAASFGLSLAMSQPALYATIQGIASFALVGTFCSLLVTIGKDERMELRRDEILRDLTAVAELPAAESADQRQQPRAPRSVEGRDAGRALEPVPRRGGENELCPYCYEVIVADALKCKHCGEYLDAKLRRRRTGAVQVRGDGRSGGVAAVLEVVFGLFLGTFGIGHMYAGNVGSGLTLMFLWWAFLLINYLGILFTCGIWGMVAIVLVPSARFVMLLVSPMMAASSVPRR